MVSPSIVDAHVHFWDPQELHYPWLKTVPALERAFGPSDYAAAVAAVPVQKVIAVECNCLPGENVRETAYFARLSDAVPVAGIVAYAALTDEPNVDRTLEILSHSPKVKGIRQNVQGEPSGFAAQRTFVDGVRKVGRVGLTFDLCVTHDQLRDAAELVRGCPDTTFVLDHCGKPAIRDGCVEPWGSDLARLAKHGNVCCKLSGLLTEADMDQWQASDLVPYAERVVECFGLDRVMYGSDWPVLTLAGDYGDWYGFTESWSEHWSESERRSFYHDNAVRVYHL
jgi:L-fuconolactonase